MIFFFIVVYEDTLISSAMIGLLCDAGSLSRDTPLAFSPATPFLAMAKKLGRLEGQVEQVGAMANFSARFKDIYFSSGSAPSTCQTHLRRCGHSLPGIPASVPVHIGPDSWTVATLARPRFHALRWSCACS